MTCRPSGSGIYNQCHVVACTNIYIYKIDIDSRYVCSKVSVSPRRGD